MKLLEAIRVAALTGLLAISCRVERAPERVEPSRSIVSTLTEPEAEEGVWSATGAPVEALAFRDAVLLDDGRVLTVGGEKGVLPSRSAEIWSPQSDQWQATAAPEEARHYPLLAKTGAGQVLVVDKKPSPGFPPRARKIEAWETHSNRWRTVGTFTSAGTITAAIPLGPNEVVVADNLGTTQRLDLSTGDWRAISGPARAASLPEGALVVSAGRGELVAVAGPPFAGWTWTARDAGWTAETPAPPFVSGYVDDLRLVATMSEGVLGIQPSAKRAAWWARPDRGGWHEVRLADAVYEATRNLFALANGRVLACQSHRTAAWTIVPRTGEAGRAASLPYAFHEGTVVPFRDGGALLVTHRSAEVWQPRVRAAGRFLASTEVINGQCCDSVAALADGKRIIVARARAVGAAIWDTPAVTWSVVAGMAQDRVEQATIGLRDGRVLVAGGLDRSKSYGALCRPGPPDRVLSSTEMWDPATGRWSSGGTLNQRQSRPTLLQLRDGRILALHGEVCRHEVDTLTGCVSELCRSSAQGEVGDPSGARWTTIAPYSIDRPAEIGAAVLADGRVLVAGGSYDDARAEIWDPITGHWSTTAPMSSRRVSAQVTALPDGRALVTGGRSSSEGDSLRSAELFDPRTNGWIAAAPMPSARRDHSAVLLADGRVLVAGCAPGEEVARAEVWNPTGDQWSVAGNVRAQDPRGRLFALRDGSALFVPVREPIELWRPNR